MEPIELSDANLRLGPPRGWSDERCSTVYAYAGTDGNGPYVVTAWQPSEEDKEAIAAGRPIFLKFCGVLTAEGNPTMMPASLYTTDENNVINV